MSVCVVFPLQFGIDEQTVLFRKIENALAEQSN